MTFTSGDEAEIDVGDADNQSGNSFAIVNASFFPLLSVMFGFLGVARL